MVLKTDFWKVLIASATVASTLFVCALYWDIIAFLLFVALILAAGLLVILIPICSASTLIVSRRKGVPPATLSRELFLLTWVVLMGLIEAMLMFTLKLSIGGELGGFGGTWYVAIGAFIGLFFLDANMANRKKRHGEGRIFI